MDCTNGSFNDTGWSLDVRSDGRASPMDGRTSPDFHGNRHETAHTGASELSGSNARSSSQAEAHDHPMNHSQFRRLCSSHAKGSLDTEEHYDFMFKQRRTHGRAIHVAALHRDGAKLVSLLLESRAQVNDRCHAVDERDQTDKRTFTLQPIHLAVGHGHVNTLRILLAAGADVQAKTLCNGVEHYTPIHEGAYFGQAPAVRVLLENDANPNCVNWSGQTPLHIASAVGCWRCAQHLATAGADLRVEDSEGNTALMTAIAGCYPDRKLHILARECMNDLMEVAKEAPSAAAELLKDTDAWRKGLMDATQGYRLPTVKDLVTLLAIAPKVAGLLLDVLTVKPSVEDPFHNPLPRHARHDMFDFRLCEYTPDTIWKHYPDLSYDRGVGDKFRHVLSQKRDGGPKDEFDEVMEELGYQTRSGRLHIRMLQMPNIVCFDLLNALSRLSTKEELELFQRSAVQAVLDFTWFHLVRLEYTVNLVIKVLELSFLVWVTFAPPPSEDGRRITWSLLTATSTRSAFAEVMQMKGYHTHLKSVKTYVENTWNYVDIGTIALSLALTWGAVWDLVFDNRELLAFVSFFRWIQLLYNTGAYRFLNIGYKIVPIFQSFFQVSGIATITLFTFLAFFHAFAALEYSEDIDPSEVFLNAFKLLLIGDGDGIQYQLNLGGRGDNGDIWTQCFFYFGVLIFCVCILNLFIAVHGGAYDAEYARVAENFYRNRACICLCTMLQPRWRRGLPLKMKPLYAYLLLIMVAVPIWLVLLLFVDTHPVAATAWLLLALSFGDALLRKRPWKEKNGYPWNFWGEEDMRRTQITPKVTPESIEPLVPPGQPEASAGRPAAASAPTAFPFPTHGDAKDAFDRTQTPERTHTSDRSQTTNRTITPPIPEAEHWPASPGGKAKREHEPPGLPERTAATPDMAPIEPRDTERTEKSLERSEPSNRRLFGSIKTTTPRLKSEMYLWWCSWAEEEVSEGERQREADSAMSESFGRLDTKVGNVARRLNSQDMRFTQVEQRVDGLGRSLKEDRYALAKSVDSLSARLDGRISGSGGPHFGAVDVRLGSLEAQVSELQRSIVQLTSQLRPACDAFAAAGAPPSVARSPQPDMRGPRPVVASAERGARGTKPRARSREASGRRDRSAARQEAKADGAGASEAGHQRGAEAEAGDVETVRSADAGGGRPRSAGTAGASPLGSHGDDAGGVQEPPAVGGLPIKSAIDLRSVIVGYPAICEGDNDTPSFCLGSPKMPAGADPASAKLPLPLDWGA